MKGVQGITRVSFGVPRPLVCPRPPESPLGPQLVVLSLPAAVTPTTAGDVELGGHAVHVHVLVPAPQDSSPALRLDVVVEAGLVAVRVLPLRRLELLAGVLCLFVPVPHNAHLYACDECALKSVNKDRCGYLETCHSRVSTVLTTLILYPIYWC